MSGYIRNSVRVLISYRDVCFHLLFPCELIGEFLRHTKANETQGEVVIGRSAENWPDASLYVYYRSKNYKENAKKKKKEANRLYFLTLHSSVDDKHKYVYND